MLPIEAPNPVLPAQRPANQPLREADAVEIWLARWLGVRRKDVVTRFNCDPRRIYEIWEGKKFPSARDKALALFRERYPALADQVDFSHHRRIARQAEPERQLDLF